MGALGSNILSRRRREPDASMPKNPDEIEAKVRNRLSIDEAGSLTVSGLRSVILPVRTLADLSAAGERIIGSGMAGLLYLAGELAGEAMADVALRLAGGAISRAIVLDAMRKDVEMRGFGRISVESFDATRGEARIRVRNSAYADAAQSGKHGCRFPAGFWAGVVGALARRPVVSEEMRCRRDGADACEFHVAPAS